MNRTPLLLLFCLMASSVTQAQINWGDYSQSFTDVDSYPAEKASIILTIPKDNNSFWTGNGDSKYFTILLNDSSFASIRPKNIVARTTFDSARAHFFLKGVNKDNAGAYEFRVVEYPTNKTLIPWQSITRFSDSTVIKSSAMPQMAYLGGYKTDLNKLLIVDVRRKGDGKIVATSLIAWESIKPIVSSIYTSEDFDEFLKLLQYPWAQRRKKSASQFQQPIMLASTNTNLIFSLEADIYHKEQVQYELVKNGTVFIPWKINDYDNSFVWIKDLPPGKYLIKMRYTIQPQHITQYNFEIEPAWYQTAIFKIVIGVSIMIVLGSVFLLIMLIQQRRKAERELTNKSKIQLELKYLYAQLNPHFVFNSLSSIQGLINKQDINGANQYLSDFATLMRESLNRGNKDDISMNEELGTLSTYLKLEQLRFGFHYTIDVDDTINIYETNMPSLLLQPLIENAVKHGVSHLQQNGVIAIHFKRNESDMTAIITDNGNGFDAGNTSGYGLKLTYERIKLLNQLNREQKIILEFTRNRTNGTEVRISFSNWFL